MVAKIRVVRPFELRNAVFFTEGDPLQQSICRIQRNALSNKIKLLILLANQLVIPSTHILESDLTRNIFMENKTLLSKPIFLISTRLGETSFRDVILSKRQDSSFYFDYHNPSLQAAVETLDEALPTIVVRNHRGQSDVLKRSVLRDLVENNSPLVKRMRIGESTRKELVEKINELPRFSRDDIAILSQPLSIRARRALVKHTNALYYLCGARWNESDPEVHATSIPIYQDQFDQSISRYSERLFIAIIQSLGLRQDLLDKLTIQDVIQLRDEEVVCRFRNAYLNLLDEVRIGHLEKVQKIVEASAPGKAIRLEDKTLESSVLEALGKKVAAEHELIGKRDQIKHWWSLTSFSTTLLSVIGGIVAPSAARVAAVVGGVSATAGFINTFTGLTDPLIDYLFKLQPTEFLLFAAHIIKSRKSIFK